MTCVWQDVPAPVENVHYEFVDQQRNIFYIGQYTAYIPARLVGPSGRFKGQFVVGIRTITGFYISYLEDSAGLPAPNSTYYSGFIEYPDNVGLGFAPDFPAGDGSPQKGSQDILDTALFTAASSLKTAVLQDDKLFFTFAKDNPLQVLTPTMQILLRAVLGMFSVLQIFNSLMLGRFLSQSEVFYVAGLLCNCQCAKRSIEQ